MPNPLKKIFLGLIILICVFFVSFNQSTKNAQKVQQEVTNQITVGNKNFKVLHANTPELRQKGLSGRATIGADEVMVFVFEQSARNFFWMKDMLFPIDIVWLDADKKVIHIESAVKSESYPKSFGPDADSKYVLEFKAGVVKSSGLKVGNTVDFVLPISTTEVAIKVDTSPLTSSQIASLILDSAFEKNILQKSPVSCFRVDIQNRGILNEIGDSFLYSEVYVNEQAADARCIPNNEYRFTKEEPLHTVINLKTNEVIIQNPGDFNPCFGVSYGECKE